MHNGLIHVGCLCAWGSNQRDIILVLVLQLRPEDYGNRPLYTWSAPTDQRGPELILVSQRHRPAGKARIVTIQDSIEYVLAEVAGIRSGGAHIYVGYLAINYCYRTRQVVQQRSGAVGIFLPG